MAQGGGREEGRFHGSIKVPGYKQANLPGHIGMMHINRTWLLAYFCFIFKQIWEEPGTDIQETLVFVSVTRAPQFTRPESERF